MTTPIDDPHDICACGDYRRDHPNGGRCTFGLSHGVPREYATYCEAFKLMKNRVEQPCAECARGNV